MKIKLNDGTVAEIKIQHEYPKRLKRFLNDISEAIERYRTILRLLEDVVPELQTFERQESIEFIKNIIKVINLEFRSLLKFPNKTTAYLTYNNHIISAFASISKEDADMGLHDRRIGHHAAIKQLMYELSYKETEDSPSVGDLIGLDKGKRAEIAAKIIHKRRERNM